MLLMLMCDILLVLVFCRVLVGIFVRFSVFGLFIIVWFVTDVDLLFVVFVLLSFALVLLFGCLFLWFGWLLGGFVCLFMFVSFCCLFARILLIAFLGLDLRWLA